MWKSLLQIQLEGFIFHQACETSLQEEAPVALALLDPDHELVRDVLKQLNGQIYKKNFSISGKKEKGAPDLNNQDFFPTLTAAVAIEQNNLKLKKYNSKIFH